MNDIKLLSIFRNVFNSSLDLFRGLWLLRGINLAQGKGEAVTVTILGSARNTLPKKYYDLAEKIGEYVAEKDWVVMTGGGTGIMESVNKGAYPVGIKKRKPLSIASRILGIEPEKIGNEYLQKSFFVNSFFIRKKILFCSAEIFIYLPGGYGTLDELFEVLNLVQTKKFPTGIPIILVGREFWGPIIDYINKNLKTEYRTVDEEDYFFVCDTFDEFKKHIDSIDIINCRGCDSDGFV